MESVGQGGSQKLLGHYTARPLSRAMASKAAALAKLGLWQKGELPEVHPQGWIGCRRSSFGLGGPTFRRGRHGHECALQFCAISIGHRGSLSSWADSSPAISPLGTSAGFQVWWSIIHFWSAFTIECVNHKKQNLDFLIYLCRCWG